MTEQESKDLIENIKETFKIDKEKKHMVILVAHESGIRFGYMNMGPGQALDMIDAVKQQLLIDLRKEIVKQ